MYYVCLYVQCCISHTKQMFGAAGFLPSTISPRNGQSALSGLKLLHGVMLFKSSARVEYYAISMEKWLFVDVALRKDRNMSRMFTLGGGPCKGRIRAIPVF